MRLARSVEAVPHRFRQPALVAVLIALIAGAMTLIGSADARGAIRSLVASGWRLPTEAAGSSSTSTALGPDGDTDFTAPGATSPEDHLPPPALHWTPSPGATWQWLPAGAPDLTNPVDVYDLPLATTSANTVAAVHARGAHAICWIPVGLVSSTSPHAGLVPPALLGKAVPSHPDERYLDIRDRAGLTSYVTAQLDECWTKGFDAVDAAAIDTFVAPGPDGVGFPITAEHQRAYVEMVAALARARGLGFGVRSGPAEITGDVHIAHLEAVSDFAVVDRCAAVALGCGAFGRYTQNGKAVFHVEYLGDHPGATAADPRPALARFCPVVRGLGFSSILKDGSGGDPAWRAACA